MIGILQRTCSCCPCLKGLAGVQEPQQDSEYVQRFPTIADSNAVGLFYDDRMAEHKNVESPDHPEQPARIVKIFERLEFEGLAQRCMRVPSRRATREELLTKHSVEHVSDMFGLEGLTDREAAMRGKQYNSVFFSAASAQAALLSAGCVIEATRRVCSGELGRAACVVRPPGHHAECGCAMGFCLFGNVAVAAATARQQGLAERVLIVDWDVHHGNGTQHMFEDDPSVLFFSSHRHDRGRFYPGGMFGHYTSHGTGAGEGFSVNVPWDVKGGMREGAPPPGDEELLAAWSEVLLPIASDFKPDLVLVSAGFDSAQGDPLGGCRISPAGFHELTRQLLGLANGRLVLALEGGYNLESISASMAACVRALLRDPSPRGSLGVFDAPAPYHAATVREVRQHLREFWPALRRSGPGGDGGEPLKLHCA